MHSKTVRYVAKFGLMPIFLASTALGQAAFAQSADSGDQEGASSGVGIRDIIVTARKREETLQDTPVAISAISGAMLEESQFSHVDDLAGTVPNLTIYNSGGLIGTPIFSLRGISTTDFIPTNENPVALYVDGVYVARQQGALFALEDLERVEVLRGPQGTLNGRNATAGSISLYTKNPEPDFGFSQKFSYGTFQDFKSVTTLNIGELGNSGISVRGSYYYNNRNGYVHNLATRDKGLWPGALEENAALIAVRGEWGNLTVDYKFDYDKKVGQGPPYQVTGLFQTYIDFLETYNPGVQFIFDDGFVKERSFRVLHPSRDRVKGHSLNIALDVSDNITLKSITGHRKIRTIYNSVFAPLPDGTVGNVSISPAGPFSIQPIEISNIERVLITQKQWSQEFQLLGNMDRLSYVLGLYYFREKAFETYGELGSTFLAILSPTEALYGRRSLIYFDNVAKSKAAFGQVTYVPALLDDRVELAAGMRYTSDKKHLVQTDPAPGTDVVPIPRDVTRKDDNFSAEGSIKVKWTPDVMTYFRVAQAYKAGGFSPRDTTFSPNGYAPEKVLSYELGFKTDLFDRRLRFNANVFHSTFKNIQVNQSFSRAQGCQSAAICSTTVANGKAVYKGFEAELTAVPVSGLEFNGSVGYVDAKWKKLFTTPAEDSDISGEPGVIVPNTSKWTASGSAKYTIALPFADLSLRAAVSHYSKRYFANRITDASRKYADPGFTNVSAQIVLSEIDVRDAKFTLTFYGDNLRNKHALQQSIDATVAAGTSYGPGRTFGVSIKGAY